jgi:hypothetical protein
VEALFHCPLLAGKVDRALEEVLHEGRGGALAQRHCALPVLSTANGSDMRARTPTPRAF